MVVGNIDLQVFDWQVGCHSSGHVAGNVRDEDRGGVNIWGRPTLSADWDQRLSDLKSDAVLVDPGWLVLSLCETERRAVFAHVFHVSWDICVLSGIPWLVFHKQMIDDLL